eukprot:GCRY01001241.1.p1 GENE.GCRY01001241.1~~GCRY01001241.1.p1  ORF type:complete len:463 (+),score=144.34 GCRY01001241.1:61-1389(+)
MLDINLFRAEKGGNPDLIRQSIEKRGDDVTIVDKIIEADEQYRKALFVVEGMNRDYTKINKEVAAKKKAKENADDLIGKCQQIDKERIEAKKNVDQIFEELQTMIGTIGNLVHSSVPVSQDEADNTIVKLVNEKREMPGKVYHHHELMHMADMYDTERGAAVAGHRGYFLKKYGVMLNQALINFGISFLMSKGYDVFQTPFMMNKDIMAETAQLSQFDEELYKVVGGTEEKYLIATSEQPLSAYHRKEWIDEKELPLKYAGVSTCFRKEAGSHGKDTWGIFRVHQFEKVEQFMYTEPEKSWEAHDAMLAVAEEYLTKLGLHYRVVNIVSGELNNAAAKKYDVEAWFPGFEEYRELVSCSNCTDYQARNLEIRCGQKKQGQREKKYVHMLNSTLCATERTMCCLVENYQTAEGIVVPEVLRPFMGGLELIPFVKKAPKAPKKK